MYRSLLYSLFTLLILTLLISSCGSGKTVKDGTGSELTVSAIETQLREAPGLDAGSLKLLKRGDLVTFAGSISDFTTVIQVADSTYDEPWILVKYGVHTGWLNLAHVYFDPKTHPMLVSILNDSRLSRFFGKEMARSIINYKDSLGTIRDGATYGRFYLMGDSLQGKINHFLLEKLNDNKAAELPDWFWLNQALDGFVIQEVAEGKMYQIFKDYRFWDKIARKTTDPADDEFSDLCLALFPDDSLEYYFPGYIFQTWDYGGASLLGEGKHLNILKKMERVSLRSHTFDKPLNKFKTALMNDILTTNEYWRPVEEVLKEMEDIRVCGLNIIQPKDVDQLNIRKEIVKNYKDNHIRVNSFNGE